MRLVVAEKPSVARDLARVLGVRGRHRGWIGEGELCVTWCIGHLVELEEPAHYDSAWRAWRLDRLPMIPERFDLRPRKGALDQWKVVRRLLRDPGLGEVVNACDAGREGELIFRYAYDLAGCEAPVRRLWVSSMTEDALRRAWSELRPGERYDALGDAARCRSESDWLVGLNATRALTCRAREVGGDALFSVGRVQTPTLAMIVERDRAIEDFEPEDFWGVRATFEHQGQQWEARWFQDRGQAEVKGQEPHAERLGSLDHARAVAAATEGGLGTVARSERRRRRDCPPLHYDLTALQRRANQRFGLSADRTLSIAQDLYEKHKLITYPRTDARYLTDDEVPGLPGILQGLSGLDVYRPHAEAVLERGIRPTRRLVDASEVGDHHAILPTGRTPDPSGLSPVEKKVYDLVARRLLAALSPDAVVERATLVVAVPPRGPLPEGTSEPLRYRARGRVVVEPGWYAVDPPPRRKEQDLPRVPDGAEVGVAGVRTRKGTTRPPPRFNDAGILKAMETAGRDLDDEELARAMRSEGLGTPATRAAILQTLERRGYVERRGRELHATDKGRAVITALQVPELKSAELTGRWERRLSLVAEGRETREGFMGDVVEHTRRIVRAIAEAPPPPAEVARSPEAEVLGQCPVCGTDVVEGRSVYSCASGRSCSFVVFRTIARRRISPRMVKELLARGRTSRTYKGFRSRRNKPFQAGLALDDEGRVELWFESRGPSTPVGMTCPECGRGRIIEGRAAWGCDRWRQGCTWRLSFERDGERLSPSRAARLVERQQGRR